MHLSSSVFVLVIVGFSGIVHCFPGGSLGVGGVFSGPKSQSYFNKRFGSGFLSNLASLQRGRAANRMIMNPPPEELISPQLPSSEYSNLRAVPDTLFRETVADSEAVDNVDEEDPEYYYDDGIEKLEPLTEIDDNNI